MATDAPKPEPMPRKMAVTIDIGKVFTAVVSTLLGAGMLWLISSVNDGIRQVDSLKTHQDVLQQQIGDLKEQIKSHTGTLSRIETSAVKSAKDTGLVLSEIKSQAAPAPRPAAGGDK